MNKKGNVGIILVFFILLFTILIVGFIAVNVVGIIDFASDELTPILQEVGVGSNVSGLEEGMNYTTNAVDYTVQALPWVIGFGYVVALIFSMVFVFIIKEGVHPAFIGLYLILIVLLILGAIIISNMYQDIYEGTDEIATRLQEQTLMSYMILYSPAILTIIAFITAIFLFSRAEGGYDSGI